MTEVAEQPVESTPVIAEESSDDEMPGLENAPAGTVDAAGRAKQTRQEKKSRKALLKLGLKPVHGFIRVTVKQPQQVMFVIGSPEVYKSGTSETYVIFGEAKIEDAGVDRYRDAAKAFATPSEAAPSKSSEDTDVVPLDASAAVDASGLEETDINLVVSQTGATRAAAIAALKKHTGDIVNSIMELTNVTV